MNKQKNLVKKKPKSTPKTFSTSEFINSDLLKKYSNISQKLIIDLLNKINKEKFNFGIKIRREKEIVLTLFENFSANIATIWPWEEYIQIVVLGKSDEKVNYFSKEDIDENIISKIHNKYEEVINRK